MPAKSKKQQRAVERALITRFMDRGDYNRLCGEYGHDVVWNGFSEALTEINKVGWRVRLARMAQRWRLRLERFMTWAQREHGNEA